MSIPKAQITATGVSVPTTDEVKAGVWNLLKTCFGNDLTQTENTPQGQLAVTLTALLQDRDAQLVQVLNQFDPTYSVGKWQEGIGKIYFLTRHDATYSTAQVTFTGLNGTVIPSGFQLQDSNGYYWKTTNTLIIDTNGTIIGTVKCTTSGTISASSNTITIITTALSGLDRVTNTSPAVVGTDTESRADFETRRSESVAINSKLTDASIRGAIANLSGVTDVWVKSNYSDTATTFGATNYPVDAHAICISVVGGDDSAIGWQALVKGGTGASFMGNTNPTVTDTDTYPEKPVPYNTVKFIRPTDKAVYYKITVADTSVVTPTDENNMKSAIMTALSSGSNRARIAQSMTAFQYATTVQNSATTARIVSIHISTDNSTWKDSIEFGIDEFPVSSPYNISVVGISS
ncbi:MAG: hypothetical protein [Caudoviricetes sp.]|nr:MAG: hypothetical protein [Caudoviricetes sp.]